MIKLLSRRTLISLLFAVVIASTFFVTVQSVSADAIPCPVVSPGGVQPSCAIMINQRDLGFIVPSLSGVLTFAIRAFFIVAGLAALLYLLLGALSWVTSGGDKESVSKAQSKITNAIIGVVLIAVVLAVAVTLEQVVFARNICLGLSCPITIPGLIQPLPPQ